MRTLRVYKGNLVPARNPEGGVLLVTEAPDPQEFGEYLKDLRRFLKEAVRLSGVELSEAEERLELVADLIALFYKAPLLEEPIRGLHLSPFKAYLAYRILRGKFEPLRLGSMRDVLGTLGEEVRRELEPVFSILGEAAERSEKVLTGYPADTRPGYNLSSLLVHWLTVSALAWSKGCGMELGRRELARLRVASLLHDVGKPLEPRRHVGRGIEEIRRLLEGLVDREDLDAIVEIVAAHHERAYSGPHRREVEAIKDADRFSSRIDRLGALVREVVLREIAALRGVSEDEAFSTFYASGGPGAWDAWEELERSSPGIVKRLTEECVRSLILRRVELGRGGEEAGDIFKGTSLLKLDVASIQEFIRESEKLPLLAASSYIVDLAVMFNSLRAVQERLSSPEHGVWYPVEGFLYSAGGNVLAVVPDGLVEEVRGALETSFSKRGARSLGFGPLRVKIAATPLSSDYGGMMEDLDRRLLEEGISLIGGRLEPGDDPYWRSMEEGLTGIERVCDYCRRRPATGKIDVGEETYVVCEECWERYSLFRETGHMRARWERARTSSGRTPGDAFGLGWEGARDILLELIAGHDSPEELEGERILNVAVLKVDGNLMGAFMARSVSLSDALERSARIDLALKKAFRRALKALRSGVSSVDVEAADREEARLLLGIQYMGGDDSLIISPSWAALPISAVLAVEFAREMGYSFWEEECAHTGATLSVGLVAAPPRHNIWALLDAAESLLSLAKSLGRFPLQAGALAFDVTEGGLLTGRAVRARRDALSELGLTSQPWAIGPSRAVSCDALWTLRKNAERVGGVSPQGRRPDALRFLASLLGVKVEGDVLEMSDEELMRIYSGLFEGAYRSYLHARNREESRVKEMRDAARELSALPGRFGVSPGETGYQAMVLLFAASRAREMEGESELYEILVETFRHVGTPLEDVSRLCKILLGGAA